MVEFEGFIIHIYVHVTQIEVMCQSNCSAPISPAPGQPRGQRKNVCDEKGRGTRKKADFSD